MCVYDVNLFRAETRDGLMCRGSSEIAVPGTGVPAHTVYVQAPTSLRVIL